LFNHKPNGPDAELEIAIESAFAVLATTVPGSDEHIATIDTIEKLMNLRHNTSEKTLSPDVLVTVGGHLAGILIIVGYERMNAMTSRALNFVMKLR
jgi:hypothetical protein